MNLKGKEKVLIYDMDKYEYTEQFALVRSPNYLSHMRPTEARDNRDAQKRVLFKSHKPLSLIWPPVQRGLS